MKRLSAIFFVLGIGLLGYLIYSVGPATLWKQLTDVGPGFLLVIGVGLTSLIFLAAAWKELLYPERTTATVYDLATAGVIGFAINEVTPGSIAGEPVKAAQLRAKVRDEDLVSSLILHNYLYLITNFLQIALGAVIGLIWLEMDSALMVGTIVATIAVAIILTFLGLVIRWGMAERFIKLLRFLRLPIKNMEGMIQKARDADRQARSFYRERRSAFVRAFAWIFLARAMAVVEIWVILWLIGFSAGFPTLMLLQASSLLVYVIFFFVPAQMGANELGSAVVFKLLYLDPKMGLGMEIVRRLRKISIALLGLSILGYRTLTGRNRRPSLSSLEAEAQADAKPKPSAT